MYSCRLVGLGVRPDQMVTKDDNAKKKKIILFFTVEFNVVIYYDNMTIRIIFFFRHMRSVLYHNRCHSLSIKKKNRSLK